MRRCFLIAAVLAATALPAAVWAASPVGYWKTIDDDSGEAKSIVRISEHEGKLRGRIVELLNRPEGEEVARCEECEGERKGQPIEGMVILWGLEPDADGEVWSDGTILDPANGKTYDAKIWLEDGKLKVRGYVVFFYRTQQWLPVEASAVE